MPVDQLDQIQKQIVVHATPARVWQALSDLREFATWFQVRAEGEFVPGARVAMSTTYPGCEGDFVVEIVEMVPERRLSWRWHPGGTEAGAPAPDEPRTLVVFDLEAVDGGTLVRVTESGFNQVPAARRARAFADNDEGWQIQIHALERYVSQAS